ncbi:malto-oligosyltrehalose synthase [Devosia algicola]|uniref:Malto-oligosyltrehalose synthase n=1 Tax=Devosia algicola TaxID=3026418 RepID=A0ABY7YPQ2_9HYPH|nr:malto-oligosyltrehalose synthase [Devosia algicola]WDR03229.1 malto-oligosyltrehalose synthase [Devosia algicola]
MIVPRATYRLQLNKNFTFVDAEALVPYLSNLGISHVYLSPILKAQPGSTHGYDTVDHNQLNPELGSLDDFRRLIAVLRQHEMGAILDFVPNHMGVGGADNGLWLDVLKHGANSQFADWFDIEWHPPRPDLEGKILVPFLGQSYAQSLLNGQLRLDGDGADFAVWANGKDKLPIRTEDERRLLKQHGTTAAVVAALNGTPGQASSWTRLDALIADQHWRIAHFSVAADDINYRRFFVNSELAGIQIEHIEVFAHAHSLIFSLIGEGLVDGLRIDHVDGLLDPKAYLETLRAKSPRPIYLVIEKILAPHELLRPDWPVDGTTGYEVGAQLTRLLMCGDAEPALDAVYQDFVGTVTGLETEAYRCKLRVMDNELFAELSSLARHFMRCAMSVPATRDMTGASIRRALREIIAHLTVYRTYMDDHGTSERDRREIGVAVAKAKRAMPQIQPALFEFVAALLCRQLTARYEVTLVNAAIARFQQYSGPVMAKGLEDTALYRLNRLIALNEVGAHPDRFAISIDAFHDANQRRLQTHRHNMIATSTHDTKRSEDTRAAIASIADEPALWESSVVDWRLQLNGIGAQTVAPNDLYLFFQLLLGGWPINGEPADLGHRLKNSMIKSLREARQRSDWGVNNTTYETSVCDFIDRALSHAPFMTSFHAARTRFVVITRRKGLIQVVLKLTIPGVPDIYRGTETWEQSYMDPDNRRPVDFSSLGNSLNDPDPRLDEKLILTQTLLHFRRQHPDLFAAGSYEPLDCGANRLAFQRQYDGNRIVVCADLSSGHVGAPLLEASVPDLKSMTVVYGDVAGPVIVLGGDAID